MTTTHPPPTPRFPPRAVPPGTFSECYTPAEQRLLHYVNETARHSDKPGSELREAWLRLDGIAGFWELREQQRAELDERTDPKDSPQPCPPVAPATVGVPPCKSEPLSNALCECVGAGCGNCPG